MGILLLVAGLILLLAGKAWFAAAATVGVILTIAGGVLTLIPLVAFIVGAIAVGKTKSKFDRW